MHVLVSYGSVHRGEERLGVAWRGVGERGVVLLVRRGKLGNRRRGALLGREAVWGVVRGGSDGNYISSPRNENRGPKTRTEEAPRTVRAR